MPFEISGVDLEISKFAKQEAGLEERCKRAVKGGGKLAKEALQAAAPHEYGFLEDSIKQDPVQYDTGNGYYAKLHPEGYNPSGQPLAKIGNILEYGRDGGPNGRGRIAPMGWVSGTMQNIEGDVVAEMDREFGRG